MTAFTAALRCEYRKLMTTRMWWILLIAMAAYMAFVAGVFSFSMMAATSDATTDTTAAPMSMDSPSGAIAVYTIAVALGFAFPVIIGAMSVTGEFRHHTITTTFLADPRRGRVLLAKLGAAVPMGLVYGVAGIAAGTAAGAAGLMAAGSGTYLSDPHVLAALGRAVLALMVWTVLGVALGAAIPNQVVVIVGLLVFTQFLQPLLRTALTALADGQFAGIAKFLPGAAGEAISGSSIYSDLGMGGLLSWWQGLLVLIAYVAVFAVIGWRGAFRRDIT